MFPNIYHLFHFLLINLICIQFVSCSEYETLRRIPKSMNTNSIIQIFQSDDFDSYHVNISFYIAASKKCAKLTECDEIQIMDTLLTYLHIRFWHHITEQHLIRFLKPLVFKTTKTMQFYEKMYQIYSYFNKYFLQTLLGTAQTSRKILSVLLRNCFTNLDATTSLLILHQMRATQTIDLKQISKFVSICFQTDDIKTLIQFILQFNAYGHRMVTEVFGDVYKVAPSIAIKYIGKLFRALLDEQRHQTVIDLGQEMMEFNLMISTELMHFQTLAMINIIKSNQDNQKIPRLESSLDLISENIYRATLVPSLQTDGEEIARMKTIIHSDIIATIELFKNNDLGRIVLKIDKWCSHPQRSWILLLEPGKFDLRGWQTENLPFLLEYIVGSKSIDRSVQLELFFDPSQQSIIERILCNAIGCTDSPYLMLDALFATYSLPISSKIGLYLLASKRAPDFPDFDISIAIMQILTNNVKAEFWETVREQELMQLLQPMAERTTNPKEFYEKLRQIYTLCKNVQPLGMSMESQSILECLTQSTLSSGGDIETLLKHRLLQQVTSAIHLFSTENDTTFIMQLIDRYHDNDAFHQFLVYHLVHHFTDFSNNDKGERNDEITARIAVLSHDLFNQNKYRIVVLFVEGIIESKGVYIDLAILRYQLLSINALTKTNNNSTKIAELEASLNKTSTFLEELLTFISQKNEIDISELRSLVVLDVTATIELYSCGDETFKIMEKIGKWCCGLKFVPLILIESAEIFNVASFSNKYIPELLHYILSDHVNIDCNKAVTLKYTPAQQPAIEEYLNKIIMNGNMNAIVKALYLSNSLPMSADNNATDAIHQIPVSELVRDLFEQNKYAVIVHLIDFFFDEPSVWGIDDVSNFMDGETLTYQMVSLNYVIKANTDPARIPYLEASLNRISCYIDRENGKYISTTKNVKLLINADVSASIDLFAERPSDYDKIFSKIEKWCNRSPTSLVLFVSGTFNGMQQQQIFDVTAFTDNSVVFLLRYIFQCKAERINRNQQITIRFDEAQQPIIQRFIDKMIEDATNTDQLILALLGSSSLKWNINIYIAAASKCQSLLSCNDIAIIDMLLRDPSKQNQCRKLMETQLIEFFGRLVRKTSSPKAFYSKMGQIYKHCYCAYTTETALNVLYPLFDSCLMSKDIETAQEIYEMLPESQCIKGCFTHRNMTKLADLVSSLRSDGMYRYTMSEIISWFTKVFMSEGDRIFSDTLSNFFAESTKINQSSYQCGFIINFCDNVNRLKPIWNITEQHLLQSFKILSHSRKPIELFSKLIKIYERCHVIPTTKMAQSILYPAVDPFVKSVDQRNISVNSVQSQLLNACFTAKNMMRLAMVSIWFCDQRQWLIDEISNGFSAFLQHKSKPEIAPIISEYLNKLFHKNKYEMVVDIANALVQNKLHIGTRGNIVRSLSMLQIIKTNQDTDTDTIQRLEMSLDSISSYLETLANAHDRAQLSDHHQSTQYLEKLIQFDVISTMELFSNNAYNCNLSKIMMKIDKWCNRAIRSWILFDAFPDSFDGTQQTQIFKLYAFDKDKYTPRWYTQFVLHYLINFRGDNINRNIELNLFFNSSQKAIIEDYVQKTIENTDNPLEILYALMVSHSLPISNIDLYLLASKRFSSLEIINILLINSKQELWRTVTERQIFELVQSVARNTSEPQLLHSKVIEIYKHCSHLKRLGFSQIGHSLLQAIYSCSVRMNEIDTTQKVLIRLYVIDNNIPHLTECIANTPKDIAIPVLVNSFTDVLNSEVTTVEEVMDGVNNLLSSFAARLNHQMFLYISEAFMDARFVLNAGNTHNQLMCAMNVIRSNGDRINFNATHLESILNKISYRIGQFNDGNHAIILRELTKWDVAATIELFGGFDYFDVTKIMTKIDKWCYELGIFYKPSEEQRIKLVGFGYNHIRFLLEYFFTYSTSKIHLNPNQRIVIVYEESQLPTIQKYVQTKSICDIFRIAYLVI